MVRPRILIYPRRMALRREVLEGVESTRDAGSEGGVLRFEMGGTVGLMERAVMGGDRVGKMCGVSGGE
jgi:hypothetical protein